MPVLVLNVYPNPWSALDANGRPSGIFACDPHEHTPDRKFVGARLDPERTRITERREVGDGRSAPQENVWTFDLAEPTRIPQTPYYLDGLRNGGLLPADEDTARTANIEFASKDALLAAAKRLAAFRWDCEHGKGAFAKMFAEPSEDEPAAVGGPKPRSKRA